MLYLCTSIQEQAHGCNVALDGSLLEGCARVGIGTPSAVPIMALLSEVGVRTVKQELVEQLGVLYHSWEEDCTLEARGVHGPAVIEEKLEERELLV